MLSLGRGRSSFPTGRHLGCSKGSLTLVCLPFVEPWFPWQHVQLSQPHVLWGCSCSASTIAMRRYVALGSLPNLLVPFHRRGLEKRDMARVSGAQRDFLLAGLWKEQEIPRWRCERKAVFPEEIAGAEARAECRHWEWRRVGMSTWQGGRQLLQRRMVLGVPCLEAACCRKWQSWVHFKTGYDRVKSKAYRLVLQGAGSVRPGNLVCAVTQPGFDREPSGYGSQVLGLHPPLL